MVASGIAVLAVTGCGGGGTSATSSAGHATRAQVRACWDAGLTAYEKAYAHTLGFAGVGTTIKKLIVDDAGLYEAGHLPSADTTPAITAHLKAIQQKCGKLR